MARTENITYTYTDDLTGEEVLEEELATVHFSYEGRSFTIDLSPNNAAELDEFMQKYIDKATEDKKGADKAAPAASGTKQNAGWTSKDVRAFWQENGGKNGLPDFKPNGRIFDAVYEAFNKKHPAK